MDDEANSKWVAMEEEEDKNYLVNSLFADQQNSDGRIKALVVQTLPGPEVVYIFLLPDAAFAHSSIEAIPGTVSITS